MFGFFLHLPQAYVVSLSCLVHKSAVMRNFAALPRSCALNITDSGVDETERRGGAADGRAGAGRA